MRRTFAIASIVTAAFLAASLAPAAFADPGEGKANKEEKAQAKEERKEMKEQQKEARKEAKEDEKEEKKALKAERKAMKKEMKEERKVRKDLLGNVSLDLSGTARAPDNSTYSFELTASGKALERVKVYRDGDRLRYQARFAAHLVVKDGNGTVVEEKDLRVRLLARGDGNGTHWALLSPGDGLPKVFLKGDAEKTGPGSWDLTGSGHAVVGEKGDRTPLRITEASGTFVRQLPAPAAAAA